ncbi:MAG: cytochrome c5 family protein [Bdellovibrionales bacterium]|nr:cytochrome c5 family protein [Massilia sp.]
MKKSMLLSLLMVAALAACSKKEAPPQAPAASSAPAVVVEAPVAAAPTAAPAAAPVVVAASAADLAIGEKVYGATCASCHGAAVLGAPKLGDKPSWTPRIAKGVDVLYKSAIEGLKMMPPRGGNAALKDEEVKAAVDYMVSKAI